MTDVMVNILTLKPLQYHVHIRDQQVLYGLVQYSTENDKREEQMIQKNADDKLL